MKGEAMSDDHQRASAWARTMLSTRDWAVLDTETTGLSREDEIVQIAILAADERVLIDTLIRPTRPIPPDATAIHGITDRDVASAPIFPEIYDRLRAMLADRRVVIYNAEFDLRLLNQTLLKYGMPIWNFPPDRVECAMLRYSAWKGEIWGDGSYKWQRLEGGDHTALGDCRATLALIRRMAET